MSSDNSEVGEKEESWRTTLRVMNEQFKSRLDENVYEGIHDEEIYHGLKLTTSIVMPKAFVSMCFCEETEEYLMLNKNIEVYRYSVQGKLLKPAFALDPTMTFARMIWCNRAKCFVCFDPEAEFVWICSPTFEGLQLIKHDFRVKAIYYESANNRIIVVGPTQAAKYSLDDTEHELEAAKAMTYNDPEFGLTWQLECSALISQSTSSSLLAASYLTTLYLMSLDLEDSDIDYDTIEYLKKQANATKSPITVIHYDESSAWIITGDQQGYVAGWNVNLECIMPPIGVHDDCVTMILPHPSVSGFLTYSYNGKDSRLQVWSCNFRGKTEAFTDLGKMNSITINRAWAAVVTIGRKLNFLIMQQLYCFFAPLSSLSKSLLITQNPMYSTKIITISKDNSIRIFSSYGKQLNVQILPNEPLHVVAAAYSGNNNELYTIILKSGEILVSDASVCPIKFRNVFASDGPRITCITLYEYFDEIRGNDRRPKRPRIFYPICIRIIVGTEQGNIIVLNNKTGKHGKNYSAHNGSVIQLHSSVVSQRVISLGIDRSVKVWRVFADLSEPLALYYTLYFIVPITKVSSMGYILCMVNSSKNSTYHQVLMENMTERVRLEHHSSKDHTATIIDMITLETLKICATSSLDNTIRIWDEENCLVKILIINTCAWNTVFSSIRGDIVFSAGRHLYKIPYKNYLSPKYRANIVADEIPKEKYEDSVPEDLEYKIYEDTVDRNNILHPISNTPLISLNIKNSDNLRMDLLIEKQVCALYRDRDEDIKKIRDNILKPAKLPGNRALMTTDIWEKYVNDLLSSITRPIPETPVYDFHNIVIKKSEDIKTYNERGIFYMLFGYSIDELDESENVAEIINNARLPLHGFLPNSILYKPKEEEVFEVESVEIIVKKSVKYQYPPEFYPKVEEEDADKRESVRLSQLMAMDNVEE